MVRDLDRYSGKGRGSGKQKPFKGVLQRRESEKRERGLGTYGCDFLFLNMTKISARVFMVHIFCMVFTSLVNKITQPTDTHKPFP